MGSVRWLVRRLRLRHFDVVLAGLIQVPEKPRRMGGTGIFVVGESPAAAHGLSVENSHLGGARFESQPRDDGGYKHNEGRAFLVRRAMAAPTVIGPVARMARWRRSISRTVEILWCVSQSFQSVGQGGTINRWIPGPFSSGGKIPSSDIPRREAKGGDRVHRWPYRRSRRYSRTR